MIETAAPLPIDVKALGAQGEIEGYAAIFGEVDRQNDVFVRGAFKGAARPLMLWQHNPGEPIGVWDEPTEDARGLKVRGRLLVDDVARAREAYALIKAGALDGLSVGIRVRKSGARADRVRELREVELVEISVVSIQAQPNARVRAKSRLTAIDCERALRDAGAPRSFAEAVTQLGYDGAVKHFANGRGSPAESDILAAIRAVTADLNRETKP